MRFHYLCSSLTERTFRLPHPLVIESVSIKRKSLLKKPGFSPQCEHFHYLDQWERRRQTPDEKRTIGSEWDIRWTFRMNGSHCINLFGSHFFDDLYCRGICSSICLLVSWLVGPSSNWSITQPARDWRCRASSLVFCQVNLSSTEIEPRLTSHEQAPPFSFPPHSVDWLIRTI